MVINSIDSKIIYKPAQPLEEDVFAYILDFNGKEIGFAVLDEATRNPDFSNCGMFWVDPYDFTALFKPYMTWR